jgi:hypothetical protein
METRLPAEITGSAWDGFAAWAKALGQDFGAESRGTLPEAGIEVD